MQIRFATVRFARARILLFSLSTIIFTFAGTTTTGQEPASLRTAAETSGLLIGTAARPARLAEPAYASTLAREFNMVEPEDALKWEVVHPQKDHFDFFEADQIVAFAIAHGMKIRGHTLVWHRQNPTWLTNGNYTSAELTRILEEHIKTVVGHYRGHIFAWDVVNEAYDEANEGSLRSTIWNDQPGIRVRNTVDTAIPAGSLVTTSGPLSTAKAQHKYDFIEQAFRWAHEADPQALLFYNEAEAETINAKSNAILAMASDFKFRHVPIDGVGFQMHISNLHPDIASIAANIKRFTALGLLVHITEMDVALDVDSSGEPRPQDLDTQANIYRQIGEACVAAPGCTAIQTWGFTDKYSWIGSHSKQKKGAALLFDKSYRAKPAYGALQRAMQVERPARSKAGN